MKNITMDNKRDIINGSQLPRFNNRPVSIVGKVQSIDPNRMSFNITATDNVLVKINVRDPVNSSVSGWVEVRGIAAGRAIDAEDYVIFSNEKFEVAGHNELCSLLYSVPNIWQTCR